MNYRILENGIPEWKIQERRWWGWRDLTPNDIISRGGWSLPPYSSREKAIAIKSSLVKHDLQSEQAKQWKVVE